MKAMGISIVFLWCLKYYKLFFGTRFKLSTTKMLREVHVQLLQN